MTLEPKTRALTTQPARVQPKWQRDFVTCRQSAAIIVFIGLALLADGDKQRSRAANMRMRSASARSPVAQATIDRERCGAR